MRLINAIKYVAAQNESVLKRVTRLDLPIAVEHPRGTMRILKDDEGKVVWKKRMYYDYGYIEDTNGRDGDEVDIMLGPLTKPEEIFVIHMIDMGKDVAEREDEDKILLGFPSAEAARIAFHRHYPKNFYGGMTVLPVDIFKKRLAEASLPGQRNRKIHAKEK